MIDSDRQNAVKWGPFGRLPFGVGELVRTTDRLIKVRNFELHVEALS